MRMLALTCIPIIGLSGCAMMPKAAEPVAYQAPPVVAKPAPVAKRAAVRPAAPRVVKKPVVHTPAEGGGGGGSSDSGSGPEPSW